MIASLALWMGLGVATAFAQDFSKTPYIEVTGKCEKYVAPDEINLSIVINEKDYAKKQSLEELEKEMLKALKNVGVDTKKDLTVVDMSSDFMARKWRKSEVKLSKAYKLKTANAKQVMQVMMALDQIGISEVSINQIKCSKIECLNSSFSFFSETIGGNCLWSPAKITLVGSTIAIHAIGIVN